MTSRSQGQSQGHKGHYRFLSILYVLRGLLCILDRGIQIRCNLRSTLLEVADPISLDMLVEVRGGAVLLAKMLYGVGGSTPKRIVCSRGVDFGFINMIMKKCCR